MNSLLAYISKKIIIYRNFSFTTRDGPVRVYFKMHNSFMVEHIGNKGSSLTSQKQKQ